MVWFPTQNSISQWSNLNDVLRQKDTKSWILMNPTSIGDTWVVAALAKSFKETHDGPLTMVVGNSQTAIAEMYAAHIDRILPVDKFLLHDLCSRTHHFSTFHIDVPIVAHPFWHGDGRLFEFCKLFRYPGRGGMTQSDGFRFILHLGWETPLAKPVIPAQWWDQADAYAEEIGMVKNNSVILFPNNNSNKEIPDAIWQEIANKFLAKGKAVYTNMVGNTSMGPRSQPFAGTKAIMTDLRLAIPLAEYAGRVIVGANGLCTLMVGSHVRANVTVLINSPNPDDIELINGQSFKNSGLVEPEKYPTEYVISENALLSDKIQDVVEDNKARAHSSAHVAEDQ